MEESALTAVTAVTDAPEEITDKAGIQGLYKLMQVQIVSLNDTKNSISKLGNRLNGIEEISISASTQSSLAMTKADNALMEIEKLRQKQLSKSIVITGVPYSDNEKIIDIIIKIFSILGVSISTSDINQTFRIGTNTKVNTKGRISPPKIVVDFTRELTRNSIFMAARAFRRPVSTADMNWTDVPLSKFFINERLTPYNNRIYSEAMKYRFLKKLKFVWTRDGCVHARIDESTPELIFGCLDDIIKALGPANHPTVQSPNVMDTDADPVGLDTRSTTTTAAEILSTGPSTGTQSQSTERMQLRDRKRKVLDLTGKDNKSGFSDVDPEGKPAKIARPGRTPKDVMNHDKHKSNGKTHHAPPIPDGVVTPVPASETLSSESNPTGTPSSMPSATNNSSGSPSITITTPTSGTADFKTPPSS